MSVMVWQTAQGRWRWRYLERATGHDDGSDAAVLPAATDHESAEAAASAARAAHPGVQVDVAAPSARPRESRWQLWAGRAVLLVIAVLAVREGRRQRRAGTGP